MAKSASYPIVVVSSWNLVPLGFLAVKAREEIQQNLYISTYIPCPIYVFYMQFKSFGFPGGSVVESTCQCRRLIQSLVWEDSPCCRATQPIIYSS